MVPNRTLTRRIHGLEHNTWYQIVLPEDKEVKEVFNCEQKSPRRTAPPRIHLQDYEFPESVAFHFSLRALRGSSPGRGTIKNDWTLARNSARRLWRDRS